MNEYEWKKARDPEAMLAAVQERLSRRKWVFLECSVVRKMLGESNRHSLGQLDLYELGELTDPEKLLAELHSVIGHRQPGSEYRVSDLSAADYPRGFAAAHYSRQAHRFEQQSVDCRNEYRVAVVSLISQMTDRHRPFDDWNLCRLALSTAEYNINREAVYLKARQKILSAGRASMQTAGIPLLPAEIDTKIRSVQKQLVEDMNKAMRNYAKPANELLAHFLHEQLGNPFQPNVFDPAWRTADVMALARGIEADRGYDRMHMLADALMEAGCEHEEMLLHLQEEREHQRGCWVLDLILGHDVELFARPPLEDVSGTGGRHEPLGLATQRVWDV